jgi:lipase chaperone LimK
VKHAGPGALDALEPLIGRLRAFAALREKSRGVFYLRSRAFLHFHEDPAGLFADVRTADGSDFERLRVDDDAGAAELLRRVGERAGSQPDAAAAASDAARLS